MLNNLTLNDGEVLVVGLYSSSKDGKVVSTVSSLKKFKDWQVTRGQVSGFYAETEFTRMDCSGLNVGDIVRLAYEKGFKGQAELIGYSFVRKHGVEKG